MDEHQRISTLLEQNPVVLFMKGTRRQPSCGFSAKVVDVLDELIEHYVTVDVLADSAIREAVKTFGQWPTLPQLYVNGKLVGGADIVTDMMKTGELATLLGVSGARETPHPEISVSEAAIAAFLSFSEAEKPDVRLTIDRGFTAEMDLDSPTPNDLVVDLGKLRIAMDPATARRANGIVIDFVEGAEQSGFHIENPNAPPRVKSLSVETYSRMRKENKPHLLLDVRTEEERETARIEGSVLLDDFKDKLAELDRTSTLVLYCHHGVRSRTAAEHCLRMGFRDVWNLEGGIEAWSSRIDPSVPRY